MGIALKQSEINANPKLAKNAIIRREKLPLRGERIGEQRDMTKELDKMELLRNILDDVEKEMSDEEIIHLILDHKVSKNAHEKEKDTFGQRAADKLARFAGSWIFVILFASVLLSWILINHRLAGNAFDPFPFILLNLILSCLAAIQAPLIMMSQNRQEEKDRRRAENDYKVNLKTEIIIQDIHRKLDMLLDETNNGDSSD